ncbi:hypothetical protein B4168_2556 [Anoxybacillus flavithermus]|nr:hypothetical protein B4168_2556 [Anoxybacillus flavithermus]OAO85224.1 hypothetical protein GT23_2915 [Parageobacillus thermoglucosidasius]
MRIFRFPSISGSEINIKRCLYFGKKKEICKGMSKKYETE